MPSIDFFPIPNHFVFHWQHPWQTTCGHHLPQILIGDVESSAATRQSIPLVLPHVTSKVALSYSQYLTEESEIKEEERRCRLLVMPKPPIPLAVVLRKLEKLYDPPKTFIHFRT